MFLTYIFGNYVSKSLVAMSSPKALQSARQQSLMLVGLVFCLLGQAFLSFWRKPLWALPFFFVGLVLWLRFASPSTLAARPISDPSASFRCRWFFLGLSVLLGTGAWFLFQNHRFTMCNTGIWLGAVILGGVACWDRESPKPKSSHNGWLWWMFGFLFAVVVIFQVAFLDNIPANPWSDHTEKLEDIHDLAEGNHAVFFPRNTGREAFQFYWTYLVGVVSGSGVSFFSLKLGTALLGIATTVFVFLLARRLGGDRMGVAGLYLYGMAFWPNILNRIGLRFPLYPLFVAAFLFFFFRALDRGKQKDWVLAGICLGLGLHGYTPFRVVPLLAVLLVGAFYAANRRQLRASWAIVRLAVLAFMAFLVFLPLARFAWDRPDLFWYRAATRWASAERAVVGNPGAVFAQNILKALAMFNWDNGDLFAITVPHRPALDMVTATLFLLGVAMALRNALLRRGFCEWALLASVVVLQLPSTLSLAFPNENPAPNRAGAAAVPAILLAAWALSVLWEKGRELSAGWRVPVFGLLTSMVVLSAWENLREVGRYGANNRLGVFDTPAVAAVVQNYLRQGGTLDEVYIVRVPHWLDTRLPALLIGVPHRDLGVDRENLQELLARPSGKLFLVKDDDRETQQLLQAAGLHWQVHTTNVPDRVFFSFGLKRALASH